MSGWEAATLIFHNAGDQTMRNVSNIRELKKSARHSLAVFLGALNLLLFVPGIFLSVAFGWFLSAAFLALLWLAFFLFVLVHSPLDCDVLDYAKARLLRERGQPASSRAVKCAKRAYGEAAGRLVDLRAVVGDSPTALAAAEAEAARLAEELRAAEEKNRGIEEAVDAELAHVRLALTEQGRAKKLGLPAPVEPLPESSVDLPSARQRVILAETTDLDEFFALAEAEAERAAEEEFPSTRAERR